MVAISLQAVKIMKNNNTLNKLCAATSIVLLAFGLSLGGNPAQAALTPVLTETGKISLSVDGVGTNAAAGVIDVLKPAGSTVRRAAFACAGTPFGRVIANGDVSIDGSPVTWGLSTFTPATPTNIFHSVYADVTAVVSAKINAAAAGLVPFTVTEVATGSIDGCILAVISDDPAQTVDRTAILLFGGQELTGDTFNINVTPAIDLSNPDLVLNFGLGIGFSAQGGEANLCGGNQVSLVDVNTVRMTSCAGNWDDGTLTNGALLTVGGLGDSNANPVNVNLPAQIGEIEDELYDLIPFVANGDTVITVDTINPSNDDLIFFAHLLTLGRASIPGDEDISKVLLEGPEEIGIYLPIPTSYVFEINYTGPEALVVDTVPAEFEIVSLAASAGDADWFEPSKGKGKSANRIEWSVPAGANTLTVTVQTAPSNGKGHRTPVYKPTSCGPLAINDGAVAYEVDENGDPVLIEVQAVTNTLELEAAMAESLEYIEPGRIGADSSLALAAVSETLLERVVIVGPSNPLIVEAVDGAKPCVEVD